MGQRLRERCSRSQPACGSQQDMPGQEAFPSKQRETRFSEGPLGDIVHIIVCARTQKPGLPVQRLPGMGQEGGQRWDTGKDPCMRAFVPVSEHHGALDTGRRPAGKADPKGHECRHLKKRGPYVHGTSQPCPLSFPRAPSIPQQPPPQPGLAWGLRDDLTP